MVVNTAQRVVVHKIVENLASCDFIRDKWPLSALNNLVALGEECALHLKQGFETDGITTMGHHVHVWLC